MSKKNKAQKQRSVIFSGDHSFCMGDMPFYGAGPIENIPEGLQRAFRAATDGKRFSAAEVDFSSISAADISYDRFLDDMSIMSSFVEDNPKQFETLLSNLHNIEKTNALLQESGLKKHIRSGDLITGAAMVSRLASALLETRERREQEVPLFVNMKEYLHVEEEQGMCLAAQETVYLTEDVGGVNGLLVTPDMLASFPPCPNITARDFSILLEKVKQFPCEIEEMIQNFQNPHKIRELAASIGMTEADFISAGGGIGCGGLALVVIVTVVVIICIVFC